jgi:transposase-like protein DUF772
MRRRSGKNTPVGAENPFGTCTTLPDGAPSSISRDFEGFYAEGACKSVAAERLVRALVLQMLYSIGCERLQRERLDYNLPFRWSVGLSMDDRIWDHSTFTKNRDRLIQAGVAPVRSGQPKHLPCWRWLHLRRIAC